MSRILAAFGVLFAAAHAEGGAAKDGARVIYTPCSGVPCQGWNARNGTIIGIGNKCLDVPTASLESR